MPTLDYYDDGDDEDEEGEDDCVSVSDEQRLRVECVSVQLCDSDLCCAVGRTATRRCTRCPGTASASPSSCW